MAPVSGDLLQRFRLRSHWKLTNGSTPQVTNMIWRRLGLSLLQNCELKQSSVFVSLVASQPSQTSTSHPRYSHTIPFLQQKRRSNLIIAQGLSRRHHDRSRRNPRDHNPKPFRTAIQLPLLRLLTTNTPSRPLSRPTGLQSFPNWALSQRYTMFRTTRLRFEDRATNRRAQLSRLQTLAAWTMQKGRTLRVLT